MLSYNNYLHLDSYNGMHEPLCHALSKQLCEALMYSALIRTFSELECQCAWECEYVIVIVMLSFHLFAHTLCFLYIHVH